MHVKFRSSELAERPELRRDHRALSRGFAIACVRAFLEALVKDGAGLCAPSP